MAESQSRLQESVGTFEELALQLEARFETNCAEVTGLYQKMRTLLDEREGLVKRHLAEVYDQDC